MKEILAGMLNVTYLDVGPVDGPAVVLLHGFPYDVHAYDEVAKLLAGAGCRCIVPYLRGYGPTRFLDPATPRSGEQAALGADMLALLDALNLERCPCRVRLGWSGGLRGRGLMAGACNRSGELRPGLQHPGHRCRQRTGIA